MGDQTIQQGDARAVADDVGVHREEKEAAFLVGAVNVYIALITVPRG